MKWDQEWKSGRELDRKATELGQEQLVPAQKEEAVDAEAGASLSLAPSKPGILTQFYSQEGLLLLSQLRTNQEVGEPLVQHYSDPVTSTLVILHREYHGLSRPGLCLPLL